MSEDARQRRWRLISLGLFYVGAALSLVPLQSVASGPIVGLGAAVPPTLLYALALHARSPRVGLRTCARGAVVLLVALHVFWAYLALSWGPHLAWTTSWLVRVVVVLTGLCAIATLPRDPARGCVPLSLPLGIWIAATLSGWVREETRVRCDDYRRAIAQPGVRLIGPTLATLATCAPGEVSPVGRIPRSTWESPDGSRFLVGTGAGKNGPQIASEGAAYGEVLCEVDANGTMPPRCVGGAFGKAQPFAEAPGRGEVFVGVWGVGPEGPGRGGAILKVAREASLSVLGRQSFDNRVGYIFYAEKTDTVGFFDDECSTFREARASDLAEVSRRPLAACPGELRYDASADEGIFCGGVDVVTATFHAAPFAYRDLAKQNLPLRAALSWGCDWDRTHRKIFVALPNLGLLAQIDQDSGQVERYRYVGFALRSVAYDARRGRVYLTDFLGGDVIAIDATTGVEVARWFAGRFVREVKPRRDGNGLVVTSNLGLTLIDLGAPTPPVPLPP